MALGAVGLVCHGGPDREATRSGTPLRLRALRQSSEPVDLDASGAPRSNVPRPRLDTCNAAIKPARRMSECSVLDGRDAS